MEKKFYNLRPRLDSNRTAMLQRQALIMKSWMIYVYINSNKIFQTMNSKNTDQAAWMCRLTCAFAFCMQIRRHG